MVEVVEHPYTNLPVFIPNTSGFQQYFSWYAKRNYHHYYYEAREAYKMGNTQKLLMHLRITAKIKGKAGSPELDETLAERGRVNLNPLMLRPREGSNKELSHILLTFKEDTE